MKGINRKGFTLIEIMIVIAIFGIVIAIVTTAWMRARAVSRSKACQENLLKVSESKEVYALEERLATGDVISMSDLYEADGTGYLKKEPKCPASGIYSVNPIGEDPTCDYQVEFPGVEPHSL